MNKTDKNNRCAIYGATSSYGSDAFNVHMEQVKVQIDNLIDEGINTFVTAAKAGYELSAVQYVIRKKAENADIHLVVVYPYPDISINWRLQPVYNSVNEAADMVKYIVASSEEFRPGHLDEWIMGQCDTLIYATNKPDSRINRLSQIDLSSKNVIYIPERIEKLRALPDRAKEESSNYSNAGQKWTKEEERCLIDRFQRGYLLEDIAGLLGRSNGAIRSRLVRLGLIEEENDGTSTVHIVNSEGKVIGEENPAEKVARLNPNNIVIAARQVPGEVAFDNFQEIKDYLKKGLDVYNRTEYSVENIEQAREALQVLKTIKKQLTEKRNELRDAYTMPIEKVVEQLDELIEMVKKPYSIIDRMIKANKKEIKHHDIMAYAESKAVVLGKYAENVINSPAFYNPKWKNISYRDKTWKKDIDLIVSNAEEAIKGILSTGKENTGPMLGFYFERLSLDGMDEFLKTIEDNKVVSEPEAIYIDKDTGEIVDPNEVASQQNDLPESETKKTDEPEGSNIEASEEKEAEEVNIKSEATDVTMEKHVVLKGTPGNIDSYLATAKNYDVVVEEE